MESPITTPKTFCFVLMPFDNSFDDTYRLGIREACDRAGAYCERVDEQVFAERILDRIYNQIAKADIVIADMTGRNPNVFYEVGYAHALGKLTVLLTQNADDIPFDLKHFPHIVYGGSISTLRDDLEKRVKYFIENPPDKAVDKRLGLELYLGKQNLASGETVHYTALGEFPTLELTVFNASGQTYASGDSQIGILTSENFYECEGGIGRIARIPIMTTLLPSGGCLHTIGNSADFLPGAYISYQVTLHSMTPLAAEDQETVVVRLFTRQGKWDFPVTLRVSKGGSN